jgi:hypothetical protein
MTQELIELALEVRHLGERLDKLIALLDQLSANDNLGRVRRASAIARGHVLSEH